ncbi:MAG TPA: flagellin [Candidatus Krumholzibacteria bacterium]|nr:flagellin [Candidatus Krumholzibacteria bacterium]HPD71646.1 flagellin [Candidatus Krumholzibacteria bacterium]HRY41421.1 flagellin [Candidatus Krumholzibacteria bacterium]
MGIRINTNVASINTQRHLYNSTINFNRSMEKLSSGLRINRAADDAAGLAISEGLKSDIRALGQASRNASDGISLVQTAEGALDEVSNILLRMRELTEQALNGTVTNTERGYLDHEYQALIEEIDRIASSTEFNGISLLDGSAGASIAIQVGVNTNTYDSIAVDITSPRDAASLGLTGTIDSEAAAVLSMAEILSATDTVSSARSDFGAVQNRLETSIRNINNQSENLAAANSRIRDVDVAKETSSLTSFQILKQAGVSMLAQANVTTGLAMKLLG